MDKIRCHSLDAIQMGALDGLPQFDMSNVIQKIDQYQLLGPNITI